MSSRPFRSRLRLPADKLTATLSQIRAVADRVVTESLQSQDVTDEFVDIEAQLRNLKALETELLALLAELRDNNNADPSKLLQVFDQIRATRGEIEQLEGRRQMLENLVSLATLQIGISPLPAAAPIVPNDPAWEPAAQAKAALRDLVEALQGLGDGLIRVGLYVLPILVDRGGPAVPHLMVRLEATQAAQSPNPRLDLNRGGLNGSDWFEVRVVPHDQSGVAVGFFVPYVIEKDGHDSEPVLHLKADGRSRIARHRPPSSDTPQSPSHAGERRIRACGRRR